MQRGEWTGAGRVLLALLLLWVLSAPAPALDLFVDQTNGDDALDGLSWPAAKATVTAALAAAETSPEPDTVSVAAGRYLETVTVPADVTLLGGFPPGGGPRDPAAHPAILDGEGVWGPVVHFPPGSNSTVLDGFTVTGGWAPYRSGGGILVEDADTIIRGNIVEDNRAGSGAGIAVWYRSAGPPARIEGNLIRRNRTLVLEPSEGQSGGGIFVFASGLADPQVVISGNRIEDNFAYEGGGICFLADGRIENTIVEGNFPSGIAAPFAVEIRNVLVARNQEWGLGLGCRPAGDPALLVNVTVAENGGPGLWSASETVEIVDSIFWGDGGEEIKDCLGAWPAVAFSLVQGGYPSGTNILDQDPLFAAGPGGDFYLAETAAGQPSTSPAVDYGSVSSAAAGLDLRTTRTDSATDAGQVDLGFHYEAIPSLTVLRSTDPTTLASHRVVSSLPFTDDPGALSDPALKPLLFYRVAEATNDIQVFRDTASDTLRLDFRRAP